MSEFKKQVIEYKKPSYKEFPIFLLNMIKRVPTHINFVGNQKERIVHTSKGLSIFVAGTICIADVIFSTFMFSQPNEKLTLSNASGISFVLMLILATISFIIVVFSDKIAKRVVEYQYKKYGYDQIEDRYIQSRIDIAMLCFNEDGIDSPSIVRDIAPDNLQSYFCFHVEYEKPPEIPKFNLIVIVVEYCLRFIPFRKANQHD